MAEVRVRSVPDRVVRGMQDSKSLDEISGACGGGYEEAELEADRWKDAELPYPAASNGREPSAMMESHALHHQKSWTEDQNELATESGHGLWVSEGVQKLFLMCYVIYQ